MATAAELQRAVEATAIATLGHPLPTSVRVHIHDNRITLTGPPATGKTRTARALLRDVGGNIRVFTGWSHVSLEEEQAAPALPDPKTGRKAGDHGTAQDVVDFLLAQESDIPPGEETAFLQGWRDGDLGEWPEFYDWLAHREAVARHGGSTK